MNLADKNQIVVVGYPKSGCTWITRLVAELIHCPAKGFYLNPQNPDVSIEGLDRTSEYEVYKSHHPYNEMKGKLPCHQVIYVVRDIRDVVLSGAAYFPFTPKGLIPRFISRIPLAAKIMRCLFWGRNTYKIRKMIETVARGDESTVWCRLPWDAHVLPYVRSGILVVRYEDMLQDPLGECRRILNHLQIRRSEESISEAIEWQSFNKTQKRFYEQKDVKRAGFLKQGRSGRWTTELSKEQQIFLTKRFEDTLNILQYPHGSCCCTKAPQ